MDFKAVELVGHLVPVFESDNTQAWLRAAFLRDTETHMLNLLEMIQQVKQSGQKTEWAGNEVWLDFYPDHIVVTHQWMYGQDGIEAEIDLSFEEAELLLHAKRATLEEYRKRKE